MPAINIVSRYMAIQYTGSNSAEIDTAITNFDITSESGGVLTAESNGTRTINTTNWVVYTQGAVSAVYTTTEFNSYYIENAVVADTSSLDGRVDSLEAGDVGIQAVGIMEAPTLLLSQSTNVDVNIIPAMPSSTWTPEVQLFASSTALGALSVTAVNVIDADTVRVTIQNSGLVSLSGVRILVVATA